MAGPTRRQVLRSAAGLVLGSGVLGRVASQAVDRRKALPDKPNLLVILTDQERYPAHWPAGLRDRLMPSWKRLASHGLTFERAYCSASQCSPSRACLVTGQYSPVNGVPRLPRTAATSLPHTPGLPNVASVLGAAGYDVYWKGKWHLSVPEGYAGDATSDEVWSPADIAALDENYGMRRWNPPDAGISAGAYTPEESANPKARAADLATAGGDIPDNDGRFLRGAAPGTSQTQGYGESALALLERLGRTPKNRRRPFAVFVSFVNPHDITFFPNGWKDIGYDGAAMRRPGVNLPPNRHDDLTTKPSIQSAYRDALQAEALVRGDDDSPANYVNFYAHLHAVVEPHIQAVLDALDAHGLTRDTLVFRTADHGELGLSHGLREKAYSAYEEMIHVPLVISNPVLFPELAVTDALYSHVDLLPTMAELARARPAGVGTSVVPVMRDPATEVQDAVLFAFDDSFLLSDLPGSHIRALRDRRWTYAIYFAPGKHGFEYELYDNVADPGQMTNLLHPPAPEIVETWKALHRRLVAKMARTDSAPPDVMFPSDPSSRRRTG